MKKSTKKSVSMLFALAFLAFTLCLIPAKKAHASGSEGYIQLKGKSQSVIVFHPSSDDYEIECGKQLKNAKKVKFTSNKPSVIKTHCYKDSTDKSNPYSLTFTTKKLGTAKLTLTYTKNGKKQKHIINVKVTKYQNPFKSVKIGKISYTKDFKHSFVSEFLKKQPVGKQKISIQTKNGWKVVSIKKVYPKNPKDDASPYIVSKVKNNTKTFISKAYTTLMITVKSKNSDCAIVWYIFSEE